MLEFFKRRSVVILLSVLWGVGLASIFISASNTRNCIIVRGEMPAEIEKKIFQYPGESEKCYTYKSKIAPCVQETHKVVPIISSNDKQEIKVI